MISTSKSYVSTSKFLVRRRNHDFEGRNSEGRILGVETGGSKSRQFRGSGIISRVEIRVSTLEIIPRVEMISRVEFTHFEGRNLRFEVEIGISRSKFTRFRGESHFDPPAFGGGRIRGGRNDMGHFGLFSCDSSGHAMKWVSKPAVSELDSHASGVSH